MELPPEERPARRPLRPQPDEAAEAWLVPLALEFGAFLGKHIFSLLIAVLVLGVGCFWWWNRAPDLSQANFNRIQQGMTEAEVKAILGTSANAHTPEFLPAVDMDGTASPRWLAWESKQLQVLICFVDGKVRFKQRTLVTQPGG